MSGRRLDDLELTLISVISERTPQGVALERMVAASGVGAGALYSVLAALEKQGLIARQTIPPDGDPAQTVYAITDAGGDRLKTGVVDRLRQPPPLMTGFRLGLAHLHLLPPQQAADVLQQYRTALTANVTNVAAQIAAHAGDASDAADSQRALYAHASALLSAELAWLDAFLADWTAKHTTPPADAPGVPTQIHKPTINPAKQMQRLKRPS